MKGSPKQVARALDRRARTLERAIRDAEKQSALDGQKVARFFSTGLYSLERLKALGHPYALRAPHPPQDPAIINYHEGRFYRGWKVRPPRLSGGILTTKLLNDSAMARALILGTARMIARPITKRIAARLERGRLRRIGEALGRSRRD